MKLFRNKKCKLVIPPPPPPKKKENQFTCDIVNKRVHIKAKSMRSNLHKSRYVKNSLHDLEDHLYFLIVSSSNADFQKKRGHCIFSKV